jgi:hypothetical protein
MIHKRVLYEHYPCRQSLSEPYDMACGRVAFIQDIHGDQKVSVHLMITTQKVTSNVQSVPCQSPYVY